MSGIESWSQTPASNNQSPPFGWPAGILPNQVEPIGRQMMASLAFWYQSAEWINYNYTPTYVSATQFTIPGNVTAIFHVGRRVQGTDSVTPVYGTITASAFTTLTTVTVVWDSGVLATGVTIVYVGITSKINTSSPTLTAMANPTALVGLAAVNGTATTAMRSDGAPAIDQAIAPTWTGVHTHSARPVMNGGQNINLNTAASAALLLNSTVAATSVYLSFTVNGGSTVNLGVAGAAGNLITGSAAGDCSIVMGTTQNLDVSVDGGASIGFQVAHNNLGIFARGATAAALVDMSPDKGTFTGTLTGMTAGTTGTVNWVKMGNIVSLYVAANILGTSNAVTMTMTGLPAAVQPVNTQHVYCGGLEDNTVTSLTGIAAITGGTITFQLAATSGVHVQYGPSQFNGAGTKGLLAGWMIMYPIA